MRNISKKTNVALALAVSLWIANGGVASADTVNEVTWNGSTANPATAIATAYTDYRYIDGLFVSNGYKTLKLYGDGNAQNIIYGRYSEGNDKIDGFTVNVTAGNWYTVTGGHSAGVVSNNTVNMSGGTVDNSVCGGSSFATGSSSNNKVSISGGTVVASVSGGTWGGNGSGNAVGNQVEISQADSSVETQIGGTVYGGQTRDGIAGGDSADDGNKVTISGGMLKDEVYGGYAQSGAAKYNTVEISGGTIGTTNAHGVYGGHAQNGAADNNIVNISGGTFSGSVWGGNGKTADGNTVTISGGNFAADAVIHGAFANGAATNNTVNILTQIAVGGLVGGESMTGASSTGNTLNIAAKGVTTGALNAFQNLNFYLPTDMTTSDTMLTVNGTAEVDGAKVGVMAQGNLTNLAKDDRVTLLHANTMNGTVSQTTEIDVPKSIATVDTYEFNVTSDTNNIYATITKAPEEGGGNGGNNSKTAEARENTKSVAETKAATTTFVNAGADMLASQGFAQAANAVAVEAAESAKNGGEGAPAVSGFTPFAAFGGSGMRAESGSYVDTRGFGLNIGFARELSNSQGKLLFGPVVEYGGGSYDSYLDNGVHGEGGSHYFGVGIMARQTNRSGFYYEGSVRGGRVTSDYKSYFNHQNVDYDSASNYWAAHLGVGKAFSLGGGNTLDGYVKYFYSHQAGDDVTMHGSVTGDEDWSFGSVDSHRVRLGARLTHKINERNSLYGGLAYQYEFGGEATAHYNGGSTPSPSVKGSSGMLELGWQVKPGEGPLTLDLGVTGWAGKQRGGSVQLGATWTF